MAVCKPDTLLHSRLAVVLALLLAALGVGAQQGGGGQELSYESVMSVLNDTSLNLGAFSQVVVASGMTDVLSNPSFAATGLIPSSSALQAFATSQGFSSVDDLVAKVPREALKSFVKFHFLYTPVSTAVLSVLGGNAIDTMLSEDYLAPPAFTKVNIGTSQANEPLFYGTDGTPAAPVLQPSNIRVNNRTAYVHSIGGVLSYWYQNLSKAATALGFSKFLGALKSYNDRFNLSLISDNETRCYFAPTDQAVAAFSQKYGISLESSDYQAGIADILSHHVSKNATSDVPQSEGSINTLVVTFSNDQPNSAIIVGNIINFTTTVKPNNKPAANSSQQQSYAVSYRAVSVGSSASADGMFGRVPVGGIVPSSYVYVLDTVLLPVYPTVWDYLAATANRSPLALYSSLIALLKSEGSVINSLKDPMTRTTFLAPVEGGVELFLKDYKRSSLAGAFPSAADQKAILQVHSLVEVLSKPRFQQNKMYSTAAPGNNVAATVSSNGALVTIATGQTSGPIVAYAEDVAILYGRSYVQGIGYVLVPPSVPLLGSGADSPLPSMLLVAFAAVLGRVAISHLGA